MNVQAIGQRGTPFVVGTPDDVEPAPSAYRDKPLSHPGLNFHQPGMETHAVRCSMAMFARELLPAIKAW